MIDGMCIEMHFTKLVDMNITQNIANEKDGKKEFKASNIVEMLRLNPQIKSLTIGYCFDKSILEAASTYLTSLECLTTSIGELTLTKFYKDLASVHFKSVKCFGFGILSGSIFHSDSFRDHGMLKMSFDRLEKFKFIYNGVGDWRNEQVILDEIRLFAKKHATLPGVYLCNGDNNVGYKHVSFHEFKND